MNSCLYYVYLYHHPIIHEPFYVGRGHNDRFEYHLWYAKHLDWNAENYHNPHLINRIRKLLREDKEPKIIKAQENLSKTFAFDLERALIRLIGRADLGTGPLLNLTDGGDGGPGLKKGAIHTEEHKKRIGDSLRGKSKSPEHIEALRLAAGVGESHYNYGMPRSEETKQRISDSQKGKIIDYGERISLTLCQLYSTPDGEVIKEQQSQFMQEYWSNEELRNQWSLEKQAFYKTSKGQATIELNRQAHLGRKHTEDTKRGISEKLKGRPCSHKDKHRVYREDGTYYYA